MLSRGFRKYRHPPTPLLATLRARCKRSRDPRFATKLSDIVGLYVDPPDVDPPAHAVVLSIDEKSQIQALDRTQPGLPIKPGAARP
jgi:hypothetical protein